MPDAVASSSAVIDPSLLADTAHEAFDADSAPLQPLPSTHFYSIEYPGYVKPTSVPLALEALGGQDNVASAFKKTRNKNTSLLELNLRPGNVFAHPIPGEIVPTNNLVLKVVKRCRKRKDGTVVLEGNAIGEYIVQTMGVISKTARFRSECMIHYIGSRSLTF
jgi:general transcription factor 3C polypeptide 5 (transcription factor C subunit 1)